MSDDSVLVAHDGGVTTLTLNRPDKFNSFNDAMHAALQAGLDAAAGAECRAILLTGACRAFCAGQDLGDRLARGDGPPDLGETIGAFYNPLMRRLRALPVPVVCAVNGVAAGAAGANIALSCDIVLAAKSARFIQAFSKIGLVPDSGGTWFLPRLVGEARAKELALLAEPLGAEMAAEWDLIWKAVDDDALMNEASVIAAQLAQGPTHGYGLIKQALRQSPSMTLDEQLELERTLQQSAGRTPDYAEGVAAFMEKRAPKFAGKP